MMRLNIAPAPWPGAPVVVLSAGLGGAAATGWRSAALEEQYQLVSYDHNGTGRTPVRCPPTTAGDDGRELFSALQAAGIARFALVGHARALIGLQLALDRPRR